MHSGIYVGTIRHRRRIKPEDEFTYPIFQLLLDLDELDSVFEGSRLWSQSSWAVARFKRSNHLGDPNEPLASEVRRIVQEEAGRTLVGPIRLLTHLSYFGYGFNPVSFYYCFDPTGNSIEALVVEVNNTPWGEQHCYVLTEPDTQGRNGQLSYSANKTFHVSPFLSMESVYHWRLLPPDSQPESPLVVHIDSITTCSTLAEDAKQVAPTKEEHRSFDATLRLTRREVTPRNLRRVLVEFPFMTLQGVCLIYWQALRLLLKRARFYPHPKTLQDQEDPPSSLRSKTSKVGSPSRHSNDSEPINMASIDAGSTKTTA